MKNEKIISIVRILLGWIFLYAGIVKVLDPTWSSGGYLKSAKTFTVLYAWFASPNIINITNWLNEWGLTLLGISLIFGVLVRLSSVLGALLMLLYYFPVLSFPYVGAHSFIVDEHIIYIVVLILMFSFRAGRIWGLDKYLVKIGWFKRLSFLS